MKIVITDKGYTLEGGGSMKYITTIASVLGCIFEDIKKEVVDNEEHKEKLDELFTAVMDTLKEGYDKGIENMPIPSPYHK